MLLASVQTKHLILLNFSLLYINMTHRESSASRDDVMIVVQLYRKSQMRLVDQKYVHGSIIDHITLFEIAMTHDITLKANIDQF